MDLDEWTAVTRILAAPGGQSLSVARAQPQRAFEHRPLPLAGHPGLEDVRLHGLRRTFASRALALCETLPVIGKPLGHSDIETTARYADLARDTLHEAAELIGAIAESW